MSQKDFRNQLWQLSQAQRAQMLLERTAASAARHAHLQRASLPTAYGRAVDRKIDADHAAAERARAAYARDVNASTHL